MKYLGSLIGDERYGITCAPVRVSPDLPNYVPANISIINYKGHLVYAIRMVSYIYHQYSMLDNVAVFHELQYPVGSVIVVGSTDGYYPQRVLNIPQGDYLLWDRHCGPEDPRLYTVGDKLYMIVFHSGLSQYRVMPVIYVLNDNLSDISGWYVVDTGHAIEKNWAPIQGFDHEFIYSPAVGNTITIPMEEWNTTPVFHGGNHHDHIEGGSSQVIPSDPNWITITHQRRWWLSQGYRYYDYTHLFKKIPFENPWTKPSSVIPFKFLVEGIEFCCGLTKDNRNLYIGFSVWDSSVYIMTIPLVHLDDALTNMGDQPNHEFFSTIYDPVHPGLDMLSYMKWLDPEMALAGWEQQKGKIPDNLHNLLKINLILKSKNLDL